MAIVGIFTMLKEDLFGISITFEAISIVRSSQINVVEMGIHKEIFERSKILIAEDKFSGNSRR